MSPLTKLVSIFNSTLHLTYDPPPTLKLEGERFVQFAASRRALNATRLERALIADINKKFRLNGNNIKAFLAACASEKLVFNYHQKNLISAAFDSASTKKLAEVLDQKKA